MISKERIEAIRHMAFEQPWPDPNEMKGMIAELLKERQELIYTIHDYHHGGYREEEAMSFYYTNEEDLRQN